jgi:hypothetical protein
MLGQLPARLTAEQTAWVLNCQSHDVPVLVAVRLLKPLGNPMPNAVKYFGTLDVLEMARDRAWLAKVTNAVSQHWKAKNQLKTGAGANGALQASTGVLSSLHDHQSCRNLRGRSPEAPPTVAAAPA